VPVLNEVGLLSSESSLFGHSVLLFARRAATLEPRHPTAELWNQEARSPERSEAKHCLAKLRAGDALELDNAELVERLLRHQLLAQWDDGDKRTLPQQNVKLRPGFEQYRYLLWDTRETASRRARLRFDRSGLRASLAHRRLVQSADCPDCKGVADTAEHVLLECPSYAAQRQACRDALGGLGVELNLATAIGGLEDTDAQHRQRAINATAGILNAIHRVAARRMRS